MKILAKTSVLKGNIQVPASKSVFQRVVAAAALSNCDTSILNPSFSDDGIAAVRIAKSMGAEIEEIPGGIKISGSKFEVHPYWNVGESGLSARMFTPIAALFDKRITISGEGTLLKRPLGVYEELFIDHNVSFKSTNGYLPVEIKGPLTSGKYSFDAEMSSQHITGLLMALPLCDGASEISVSNLKSSDYIKMTLELLSTFGIQVDWAGNNFTIKGNQEYKRKSITIDGDWSAAASLLVAGAISGNGSFEISGLENEFTQADSSIISALILSGSNVTKISGNYHFTSHDIKGFEFDATDCPDLFPVLSALAVFANSKSSIKGIHRLKHKETNRGEVIQMELLKLGIEVEIENDCLLINPRKNLNSCRMDSHGDHRIAMMATLIGLGGAEIEIDRAEAVNKSYPNFYDDLIKTGADIKEV